MDVFEPYRNKPLTLGFSPDSLFRVLSGLVVLLEANLLKPSSRLAALAVLAESKHDSFLNVVRLLEKQSKNEEEQVCFWRLIFFGKRFFPFNRGCL